MLRKYPIRYGTAFLLCLAFVLLVTATKFEVNTQAQSSTVSRSDLIRKYESLGLILFVAIPAPMTGAWTGSIAAYLFKLPLRMAIPCIILGILIAGIVVTLVSQGVISLWH